MFRSEGMGDALMKKREERAVKSIGSRMLLLMKFSAIVKRSESLEMSLKTERAKRAFLRVRQRMFGWHT